MEKNTDGSGQRRPDSEYGGPVRSTAENWTEGANQDRSCERRQEYDEAAQFQCLSGHSVPLPTHLRPCVGVERVFTTIKKHDQTECEPGFYCGDCE